MRARSLATLTLLLAAVAFTGCDSNNDENEAVIEGTVVNDDTSVGIEGAFVQIDGTSISTRTDADGAFRLVYEIEEVQGQDPQPEVITVLAFADGFQEGTDFSDLQIRAVPGATRDIGQLRLVPVGSDGNGGGGGSGNESGAARSVTLLDRDAQTVTVAGAGGTDEVAALTFVVYDAQGRPVNGENAVDLAFRICRNFDGPAGSQDCISSEGEAQIPRDATLDTYATTTANDGTATVYMTSGTQARSVQVRAQFSTAGGDVIQSEPVTVGITGGLPDQANFSVVSEEPNFALAGDEAGLDQAITAFVGDRYNNPVAEGTQVYFTTSGGIIGGSAFTDDLGRASTTLLSTGIVPSGQAAGTGFAAVTASTIGIGGVNLTAQVPDGVLFSGRTEVTILSQQLQGNSYVVQFRVADSNGNPLGPGTDISVSAEGNNITVIGDEFGYEGFVLASGEGTTEFVTTIVPDNLEQDAFLASFTIDVSSPNDNVSLEEGVGETIYDAP